MEIERKFLIPVLPEKLETYPHRRIEQAYLCTMPFFAGFRGLTNNQQNRESVCNCSEQAESLADEAVRT